VSYKTILVHCNDRRRVEALLAPAVSLADRFESHVLGLSVVPPVVIVPADPALGPPMVVDGHCELYRAENPAMRAAFESATRGRSFVAEWRDDDAGAFGVADCVLPYAHAADLVLPILRGANEVKVVWVNPESERERELGVPVPDISTALVRHGVKCNATEQGAAHGSVGETLIAGAKEMSADLLVMGCYGHARVREFVFGGASRHVLAHMPIPILMSH
jgi:nucleotide-binding universal stress UspA family protein